MLSLEETTEALRPVIPEIRVAMSDKVSADLSTAISLRVIAPVLVFVTLIYMLPSVTSEPKSDRFWLVKGQPVRSVNEPVEPTPWTWY